MDPGRNRFLRVALLVLVAAAMFIHSYSQEVLFNRVPENPQPPVDRVELVILMNNNSLDDEKGALIAPFIAVANDSTTIHLTDLNQTLPIMSVMSQTHRSLLVAHVPEDTRLIDFLQSVELVMPEGYLLLTIPMCNNSATIFSGIKPLLEGLSRNSNRSTQGEGCYSQESFADAIQTYTRFQLATLEALSSSVVSSSNQRHFSVLFRQEKTLRRKDQLFAEVLAMNEHSYVVRALRGNGNESSIAAGLNLLQIVDNDTASFPMFQRRWKCHSREDFSELDRSTRKFPLAVIGSCRHEPHIDLTRETCGCSAQVTSVENVLWQTVLLSPKRVFSLAFTRQKQGDDGRGYLHIIDRSDLLLSYLRCKNFLLRMLPDLTPLLLNLVERVDPSPWEAFQLPNVEEVFYALSFIEPFPGHNLEAILEALAQYYISGLHARRVPWLVPVYKNKTEMYPGFKAQLEEFSALLDIPTIEFAEGEPHFAKKVHFAALQFGENMMCYKPFLKNILWPKIVNAAHHQGIKALKRVAIIKAVGSTGLYSTHRSFELTSSFRDIATALEMPIFIQPLPLVAKMFYINTAETIVTTWGGTSTFVFLLMFPRKVNLFVLVHPEYLAETTYLPLHLNEKNRSDILEKRGAHAMKSTGWDMKHDEFVIRFLAPRTLGDVRITDFDFHLKDQVVVVSEPDNK